MNHGLRVEVRIRHVEAIARPVAERADVRDVGRAETAADIGDQLPLLVYVEDPAEVATRATWLDAGAVRQLDANIGITQAGTPPMPFPGAPIEFYENPGLPDR